MNVAMLATLSRPSNSEPFPIRFEGKAAQRLRQPEALRADLGVVTV